MNNTACGATHSKLMKFGLSPHVKWLLAMQGTDTPQGESSNAELMAFSTSDSFLPKLLRIHVSQGASFVEEIMNRNRCVLTSPINCGVLLTL